MSETKTAKFKIGQVVRHRLFPFRGVIFDVDPEFANSEEWYQAIPPEVRPRRTSPSITCWPRTRTPNTSPTSRAEPARRFLGRAGAPPTARRILRHDQRRQLRPQAPRPALKHRHPANEKAGQPDPPLNLSLRPPGLLGLLGAVLLFLELLGEVVGVLRDEVLQLALAVLDVGLLQRRAVEGPVKPASVTWIGLGWFWKLTEVKVTRWPRLKAATSWSFSGASAMQRSGRQIM